MAGVLLGSEAVNGKLAYGQQFQLQPDDASLNKYSLEFSHEELRRATRDFDKSMKLGSGGFGDVFRGIQSDGTDIAIKALDLPKEGGFEEEVRVLSMFRHPNLVTLMGFARHGSKRFLVYELLEGGDAFNRLAKSGSRVQEFAWRDRVCVAYDAACGLSHLHHQRPKVFHRDIKTPNILLTRSGTAKMADFGLACLSQHPSYKFGQVSGTPGYMCPLYQNSGVVTERSEVFAFGIVMLELVTARPSCWKINSRHGEEWQLLWQVIGGSPSQTLELLDVNAMWPSHVATEMADLALRCISYPNEAARPDFTEIVHLLRSLRDAPEAPSARGRQQQQQQYEQLQQ